VSGFDVPASPANARKSIFAPLPQIVRWRHPAGTARRFWPENRRLGDETERSSSNNRICLLIKVTPLTTLYVFSGLPGSGKTTLAQMLARRIGAAYLRIDTIETALREVCAIEVQGEGYRLAYRVASDILNAGVSVVSDSCNPIELTRREWEQVAAQAGATHVNIEVVCSDPREHRNRIETRTSTVPELRLPTWQDVESREYHEWTGERIVLDTSQRAVEACLDELLYKLSIR
jgi:predicted kinase